jgi:glutamate synthase domain-containing protein 2
MLDMDILSDLKKHIELLRESTKYKVPIMVKLAAGDVYEDTKLAVRAGADAVIIDGTDSNYQNLPDFTVKNLGLDSISSIPPALKAFKDVRADIRGIKLIVSGPYKSGADIFKAIAMGAHAVVINSAAEIAIGCNLCGNCNINTCPEGIATTDPKLETKLDWVEAGQKLDNYIKTIIKEFKLLMHLAGYKKISEIDKKSLRAIDYETAAVTGTKLMGYDKTLPMWEH